MGCVCIKALHTSRQINIFGEILFRDCVGGDGMCNGQFGINCCFSLQVVCTSSCTASLTCHRALFCYSHLFEVLVKKPQMSLIEARA